MLNNRKAFTLIEVVVAAIILVLIATGAGAGFSYIGKKSLAKERELRALNFAAETLEELLMPLRDFDQDPALALRYHDQTSDLIDLKLPEGSGLDVASRSYRIKKWGEGGVAFGKTITVTVEWKEAGELKQVQLTGLAVRR